MKATSTFENKLLTGPGEFSFGGARDSGVRSIAQCRSLKLIEYGLYMELRGRKPKLKSKLDDLLIDPTKS
jgi:hypothetical protein